ncbi:MAG: formate dehydrogenase accessory protein FdhE [Rhodocyclaceae bacterium]|nr:formate dehydrogenase accessory protein FdhE [Rhodocyclaceae bacterium]
MDIKPIDFNPPTEEAPAILLPVAAAVFAERAERFTALAAGHRLADWLLFLGHLTRAQHEALQSLPELPLPSAAALERARAHCMPPLDATAAERPPVWREVLRQLIAALLPHAPENSVPLLAALADADDIRLEALADGLLHGEPDPAAAGELPLVAAALQVVFTAQAARLDATQLQKLDAPGVCPCCGSLPVASLVRLSPAVNNLRYLHCGLCNAEWNVPRATCTACGGDKGLALHQIDGSDGRVRAETCDGCKSYLKIAYQEKDPRIDPVADDLATLALDLLVDEAGYGRSGPNLLLVNAAG